MFIEPFVAVRMAVGRGPEFERWVQSSAAAYDMLLNESAVDFVASLTTPTLFVCGLSDRTYVGAKCTAPKDQGAKGNIAEMAKDFAARIVTGRVRLSRARIFGLNATLTTSWFAAISLLSLKELQ